MILNLEMNAVKLWLSLHQSKGIKGLIGNFSRNILIAKELILYSRYLFWKGRFQKNWILWRIETYYGIPATDFQFRKLPPFFVLIKDLWRFGQWLHHLR